MCQWDSHLCLNLNVKISLVSLPQFTHARTLHMHYWKAAYEYWQLLMPLYKKGKEVVDGREKEWIKEQEGIT